LTLSIRLRALLAPLATQLHADPHLTMYWRRHHETVQAESGDTKAPGFLILTATRSTAKLAVIPGQLSASILLPKRGDNVADAITPRIRLMSKNAVVTTTHFLVDLDPAAEKKIEAYLRTKSTGDELELGKRFEPVIEVRGFTVDKEPAVAAVIVPTILELEPNAKATDHDEDTFVFRGVYVPPVTRSFIGKPEYWKTILNDKETLEPLDPNNEACTVSFDPKTDVVTFHILNRLKLTNRLRVLASKDKGLPFVLEQPASTPPTVLDRVRRMMRKSSDNNDPEVAENKARELLTSAFPNPAEGDTKRQVQVKRPVQLNYPRRNHRFSTLAPASNNEFPLYLAGTFTSSSNAAGKQKNIANFEVRLNISEKLVPLNDALNFGDRYSIAPLFYAKMNTTGIINDENSAIWQLPFAVDFFPGACCKTSPPDTFHLPPLRRVSLYVGYLGEASRKSDKRSNGGIAETRLFFAPMKSDNFSFKFQTNFGWEAGRYREKAINEFTSGGPAGVNRLPDGTAISESFTLTRSGTFSRLHGAVHSTFAFGPSSSLTVNYDMRRLLKAESYFDAESSAKGFFTPYTRTGFPSTFQGVDDTLAFLSLGRLEKGTRRYLDIAFNQEVNKFFDVKVSYTRGELAPAFQFVNKFEVGIALKILGKDSATSR
jgi:hypothetical protein